jgi:hypothetical protein
MGILRRAAPVALVLGVVSTVTAVLWFIRISAVRPQHLVFFYLLPIALIATLYGTPCCTASRQTLRRIFSLRSAL